MDSEAVRLSISFMHKFEESAPSPPQGREITNQTLLAPCKISFSFLLQAYKYANFQFLRRDDWTQAMTKIYLQTCCMSSDVCKTFFIMVNEVKKNNAPKTINGCNMKS
jgi:hypothetical protein